MKTHTKIVVTGLIAVLSVIMLFLVFFTQEKQVDPRDQEEQTDPYQEFQSERGKVTLKLETPKTNDVLSSPIIISGEVPGPWYFEANFPIVLTDWDGRIIGEAIATAQSDWMTEEYVPFKATLYFSLDDTIYSNKGALIFQKSNASGLPMHDDAIEIPVFLSSDGISAPAESASVEDVETYRDEKYGFAFSYKTQSDGYVLQELPRTMKEDIDLLRALVLIRNNDYEELKKQSLNREGPPAINVYAFDVEDSADLVTWLAARSNITNFQPGTEESFVFAGTEGVSFYWDGLYAGWTVATMSDGKIFMVVTTYTPESQDERIEDAKRLIHTFELLP